MTGGQWGTMAVAIAAILLLLGLTRLRGRAGGHLPVKARALLTRAELAFMTKLVPASARLDLHVCPQVSMGAVMRPESGLDRSSSTTTRNRFSSKIIDFVLMDARGRVALLVELDDRSHDRDRDRLRDAMTASAGLRTLRVPDGRAVDEAAIERLVRGAMG